jgi:RimJ/RimL family protein N-acetyltransferase
MGKIELRKAQISDAELLFFWANDTQVRANSIHTEVISWDNHIKWMNTKLCSNNCMIFIGLINGVPFGQIRFDKQENSYHIDYSVENTQRGKGLGSILIDTTIKLFAKTNNITCHFIAYVKPNNTASSRVFEKCGFNNLGTAVLEDVVLNAYQLEINP